MRILKLAAQLALVSACIGATTNALAYTKTITSQDGGAKATFYWENSYFLKKANGTTTLVPSRRVYFAHVYDMKCDGRMPQFRIGGIWEDGDFTEKGWDNSKGCRSNGYTDVMQSVSYHSLPPYSYAKICNSGVKCAITSTW